MSKSIKGVGSWVVVILIALPVAAAAKKRDKDQSQKKEITRSAPAFLWRNPFSGTRELNGLRVIMALMNNWDLKDDNNAVYQEDHGPDSRAPEMHYLISDLGASFGTTGPSWTRPRSRGDLNSYRHSKFITKVTPEYIDFSTPTRPAVLYIFNPKQLIIHLRLHWIGKHIPRSDVH